MKRKSDGVTAVDDGAAAVGRGDNEFGTLGGVKGCGGVGGGEGGRGTTVGDGQLRSTLIKGCNPHKIAAARPMAQLEQCADIDASSLRPPSQHNAEKQPQAKQAQRR